MNIHDATEVAYKNGYEKALKDFYKELTSTKKSVDDVFKELLQKVK